MPRYRLLIEYEGTGLVGWQRQDNGPSVQQHLEEAVRAFCGKDVAVMGAGRTDAGVHASGQVAHLDLTRHFPARTVMHAINHHLRPAAIAVIGCAEAAPDFHARFSARKRHYRYRIFNRLVRPVLERHFVWHVAKPLDAAAMHEAARILVGHHDFSSFRAAHCQASSPMKTLDRLDVIRLGDEVHILASARSFLHNQVRAMAGSLKLVGEGRWDAADLARALAARDRQAGGPNAPPQGLCLTGVDY
ncbi:MAG: tRNA pseudouridine(38-40) synthase TruA [Alphaproteobacteria bacterium]|nr:tRNA pseudouridine(38-40) synthase TruA [Alphaproteobacteria bacterium]